MMLLNNAYTKPQHEYNDNSSLASEAEEIATYEDGSRAAELSYKQEAALNRFKVTWDSILSKYGDPSMAEEGDVIDLETGEIVEDNGHLRSMVTTRNIWADTDQTPRKVKTQKRVQNAKPPPQPKLELELLDEDAFDNLLTPKTNRSSARPSRAMPPSSPFGNKSPLAIRKHNGGSPIKKDSIGRRNRPLSRGLRLIDDDDDEQEEQEDDEEDDEEEQGVEDGGENETSQVDVESSDNDDNDNNGDDDANENDGWEYVEEDGSSGDDEYVKEDYTLDFNSPVRRHSSTRRINAYSESSVTPSLDDSDDESDDDLLEITEGQFLKSAHELAKKFSGERDEHESEDESENVEIEPKEEDGDEAFEDCHDTLHSDDSEPEEEDEWVDCKESIPEEECKLNFDTPTRHRNTRRLNAFAELGPSNSTTKRQFIEPSDDNGDPFAYADEHALAKARSVNSSSLSTMDANDIERALTNIGASANVCGVNGYKCGGPFCFDCS